MSTVVTTAFVAGSILVIRFVLEQLGIQTAPVPTAMPPQGVAPSGDSMEASTLFVPASIRTMDPLFGTPTQRLPRPLASQFGPLAPVGPTVIAVPTRFVAGSTGSTLPPCTSATQTPSA